MNPQIGDVSEDGYWVLTADGWQPSENQSIEEASLLMAAMGETLGLHRVHRTGGEVSGSTGPPSPFATLQRRYP